MVDDNLNTVVTEGSGKLLNYSCELDSIKAKAFFVFVKTFRTIDFKNQ